MLKRYLRTQIEADLEEKMVFLGGPRQSGKTTLARTFASSSAYLNWDHPDDRARILKLNLPATDTWIFDEIHKYKNWRNYIKGLYDKRGERKILVTGSARLDLLRRGGIPFRGDIIFCDYIPSASTKSGPAMRSFSNVSLI